MDSGQVHYFDVLRMFQQLQDTVAIPWPCIVKLLKCSGSSEFLSAGKTKNRLWLMTCHLQRVADSGLVLVSKRVRVDDQKFGTLWVFLIVRQS